MSDSESEPFSAGAAGVAEATAALIEARASQEVTIVPEDHGAAPTEYIDAEDSTEPLKPRAASRRLAEARAQRAAAYAEAAADPLALQEKTYADVADIEVTDVTPEMPPATVPWFQGGEATTIAQAQAEVIARAFQQDLKAKFPEIENEADLRAVAEYDMPRAQEALAAYTNAEEVLKGVGVAVLRGDMEAAQDFQVKGRNADEQFAALNPDYASLSPAERQKEQGMIIHMLNWLGLPTEKVARLWNGLEGLSIRTPAAQTVLWAAHKYFKAQAHNATAKPAREPPRVQRPNASMSKAERREVSVAALERDMPEALSVRQAARITQARRNAR